MCDTALRSFSLLSLPVAPSPKFSSLITVCTCDSICCSLCLSTSSSAGDRDNSPWCTCGKVERQPVKEKTVRVVELISSASKVWLEDKPISTEGEDLKDSSCNTGDSGWLGGRRSPSRRFSSQRKKVCEEAGDESETFVFLRKSKHTNLLLMWNQSGKISTRNMRLKRTLYWFLLPPNKTEVKSHGGEPLTFHQPVCLLGFALQWEEVSEENPQKATWTSLGGTLRVNMDRVSAESVHFWWMSVCDAFPGSSMYWVSSEKQKDWKQDTCYSFYCGSLNLQ